MTRGLYIEENGHKLSQANFLHGVRNKVHKLIEISGKNVPDVLGR